LIIGDMVMVELANGNPLLKAGIFAEGEGRIVADQIAAAFAGVKSDTVFQGEGGCFLEVGG
jgi:sulfide:quinone oxidoreductase